MIQLQIIHSIPIVLPVFCTEAIRSIGKAKLWCLSTLFTALLLACSLAIRKDHAKVLRAWPADANLLDLFGGVEKTKLSRRRWHDHTLYLQWWILEGKSSLVSGCGAQIPPSLEAIICQFGASLWLALLGPVYGVSLELHNCGGSEAVPILDFPRAPFCRHQTTSTWGVGLLGVLARPNLRLMPFMPWQVESSCCW